MSAGPRIFISHSSEDWALTERVHDALKAAEPDLDLLLDKVRLEPGKDWQPFLHEWMARCDAGLILLTGHAVTSDWVLKEATILAWRHSMDPTFPLFVAHPADIGVDDVTKGPFSPLGLSKIQWLEGIDPDDVAQAVVTGTEGTTFEKSPFDLMVGKLADLFETVGSTSLEVVAGKLNVFKEWWPADQTRLRYVEVIARHLLCGDLGEYRLQADDDAGEVIRGLEGLMGDLAGSPQAEPLRKILGILAPHWVDGVAAGKLALLPRYGERRAVALNGRYVPAFTSRVYLTRAHLVEASKYYFLPVAGGNPGGFVAHYASEICRAVQAEPENDWMEDLNPTEVTAELRDMSPSRYVILPEPRPGHDDLVELMEMFPTINFVLWTGARLDKDPGLERVDWAEPAVDEVVEKMEMKDYNASKGSIRRQEGR